MPKIRLLPLPDSALLQKYAIEGTYTDCYGVDLDQHVSQVEFVSAFYTTWLFKLERWILAIAVKRPSSDEQVIELAAAERETFAAWHVESRTPEQLLMCDFIGRTRSWLMTDQRAGTRLYFGSAVVPRVDPATGTHSLGAIFRVLLGFHKVYSRFLLGAACSKLRRLGKSS